MPLLVRHWTKQIAPEKSLAHRHHEPAPMLHQVWCDQLVLRDELNALSASNLLSNIKFLQGTTIAKMTRLRVSRNKYVFKRAY